MSGDLRPTAEVRSDRSEMKLCFIDGNVWAYFANVEPTEMGGDDWNDAPHDCNASEPYPRDGQEVVCVAYDGPFEMAGLYHGRAFPNASADDINAGICPWLYDPGYGETYPEPKSAIWAGATLAEFTAAVQEAGGNVYARVEVTDAR